MSEMNPQENAQNTNVQDACEDVQNDQNIVDAEIVDEQASDAADNAETVDAVEPEIVTDEEIEAENKEAKAEEKAEEKADSAQASNEKEVKADETDWKDAYIRLYADFENYRKRTSKEQDEIRKRERDRVIKAWLDVYDNTERAIFALPEKEGPWYDGFCSLVQQMDKCLATFHIHPVDDLNKQFDPKKHEAIQTIPNPAMENGTIVHVESRGFAYENGEVARIARVIVVKNPS